MHRFFVPPSWLQDGKVTLTDALAHQLTHVLRMRPGDHIQLLDGSGAAYEVMLERLGSGRVVARMVSISQPQTEPGLRLVLYQALTQERKFDWVLQKGTELGVSAFVPLFTQRSLVHSAEQIDNHKLARWQRIVTEAAEQSGRARLPQVLAPIAWREVCQPIPSDTLALLAWIGPETTSLGKVLLDLHPPLPQEVRVFIGPEGDFTPAEVSLAQEVGIIPISLGPRILRLETAGLVALSAILLAWGEL
jgi:16S rRNA (uracil1498-N3)-methyltransferase